MYVVFTGTGLYSLEAYKLNIDYTKKYHLTQNYFTTYWGTPLFEAEFNWEYVDSHVSDQQVIPIELFRILDDEN